MPTTPSPEHALRQAAGWCKIRPGLAPGSSVHLDVDWVAQRTKALADRTGRPVTANGYWSSGGAFAPHADAEDAHLLQVAGQRRWWHQAHTLSGESIHVTFTLHNA